MPEPRRWKVNFFQTRRGEKPVEAFIKSGVEVRVFYTLVNNEYYLLSAFVKKSQKTPTKEIKIAIDRMNQII